MKRLVLATVALMALLASHAEALHIPVATSCDFGRHTLTVRTIGRSKSHGGSGFVPSAGLTSNLATACSIAYNYTFKSWNNYEPCDACDRCDPCHTHHDRRVVSVTLRIESFHLTGRQHTSITMPAEAPKAMRTHEENHYRISDFAYRRATATANGYARGMLGRTFTGPNIDDAKRQVDDAFKGEYNNPYFRWAAAMHQAYNDAVGDKLNPNVRTEAAYQQAISVK